jgi:hypothetical protein
MYILITWECVKKADSRSPTSEIPTGQIWDEDWETTFLASTLSDGSGWVVHHALEIIALKQCFFDLHQGEKLKNSRKSIQNNYLVQISHFANEEIERSSDCLKVTQPIATRG